MAENMETKVNPIVLENPTTGEVFTLEFNRATVKMAEKDGFDIHELGEGKILTGMSDLFYYAFKMHHPRVLKAYTDHLLFEELGGVPDGLAERLGELYAEPYKALERSEEAVKNCKWVVNL